MDAHIVQDWHDYQLLERQKGTTPCCKVSSIIIHDFKVGRYVCAKFDKLFPGCHYVSDTVANVLLDWCSNPEADSKLFCYHRSEREKYI